MEESIAPVKQFVTQLKEASQALYAHQVRPRVEYYLLLPRPDIQLLIVYPFSQIKVVESINEFGTILSSVDKMVGCNRCTNTGIGNGSSSRDICNTFYSVLPVDVM